ncbi:Uu.00g093850.m01.CDS01 [Anthostomella pinea]|uniref:Uu.00g093850.m01.CDS01 n=1 Tax=Anthostomella pinea TaxID=933095 RepID=A0AAI8VNI2_9PEZI|nr:Uu.00g093850.m01.CDS01 [Anthostomella pinea]
MEKSSPGEPTTPYALGECYCEVCKIFRLNEADWENVRHNKLQAASRDIARQAELGCKTCKLLGDAMETVFTMYPPAFPKNDALLEREPAYYRPNAAFRIDDGRTERYHEAFEIYSELVWVTRQLGFRYLWIDALCIVQDDLHDWATTLGTMGDIYGEASLNIAAASSTNGDGGCLYERIGGKELPLPTDPSLGCDLFVRCRPEHTFANSLNGWRAGITWVAHHPLSYRKWCFQERIASRQTLFYTKGEMGWECRTVVKCECEQVLLGSRGNMYSSDCFSTKCRLVQATDPASLLVKSEKEGELELLDIWMQLVMDYSIRQITHDSDIFPAMSAVARMFEGKGLGNYHAEWDQKTEPVSSVRKHSVVCQTIDGHAGRLSGGVLELSSPAVRTSMTTIVGTSWLEYGYQVQFEHWNEEFVCQFDAYDDYKDVKGLAVWLLYILHAAYDEEIYLLARSTGDGTGSYRRIALVSHQR